MASRTTGWMILVLARSSVWLWEQPVQENQREQQGYRYQEQSGGHSVPFWYLFMPRCHVFFPSIGAILQGCWMCPAHARPTCDMVPYRSVVGLRAATCMVPVSMPPPQRARPYRCSGCILLSAAPQIGRARHTLSLRRIQSRCNLPTIRRTLPVNASSYAGSIPLAYRSRMMLSAAPLRALRRKR